MTKIIKDRVCAEIDGEIVVFLIGMRINRVWQVWRWWPVFRAMPRMLAELAAHPELGMLSARTHFGLRNLVMIQYWRSAAHLQTFAKAADKPHLPAWTAFNRSVGTDGAVGIWHETYIVPPGNFESIYVNMPPYGLGRVAPLVPAKGDRATAAKRLAHKTPP